MNRSTEIGELAKAMAAAQLEMKNPGFDAANPHFRSKFASLAAVRDAVVPVFAKRGVSVTQDLTTVDGGVACLTVLMHESGQWAEYGPLVIPYQKDDAQGRGSAATYCRRYSLQSVANVVGDQDDDAEAAQARDKPAAVRSSETKAAQGYTDRIMAAMAEDKIPTAADIMREAKDTSEEFATAVWVPLPSSVKKALRDYSNGEKA